MLGIHYRAKRCRKRRSTTMDKRPLRIGVIGSHRSDLDRSVYGLAYETGAELARRGQIMLTGAATGISEAATKGASDHGGVVISISPRAGPRDRGPWPSLNETSSTVIYTGMGYKGRNLILARSSNSLIVINGGLGTLNEVTIGAEEGATIIPILGSGGVADLLPELLAKFGSEGIMCLPAKTPLDAIGLACNP